MSPPAPDFLEELVTLRMAATVLSMSLAVPAVSFAQGSNGYKVLATNKTATMQKEMQDAAAAGYRFAAVMGGETSFGGSEVVVLMQTPASKEGRFEYRLLATSKTSTLQKELQAAADAGFDYIGQTVFRSTFGGSEVAVILEKNTAASSRPHYEYTLIATSKTSTLQKELDEVSEQGYEALGMTVGQTALGGSELVVIARRPRR
jgi:hypothetical protein